MGKKRDENVDDCPDHKLGNALRILGRHAGAEGSETIRIIAAKGIDVQLVSERAAQSRCDGSNACYSERSNRIVINGQTSSADMAVTLSHEGQHALLHLSRGAEEARAWNRALNVYDRLPSHLQGSRFYGPESASRAQNPSAFNREVYCRAAQGTPLCP